MKMGKVIINGLQYASDGAGISRYTGKLIEYYFKHYKNIYAVIRSEINDRFAVQDDHAIIYSKPINSSGSRIIAEQLNILSVINKYDLIHYTDYAIPILATKPCIATIHDMALFAVTDKYTNMQIATKKFLMQWTVRKAKKLICISKFTAMELKKYFPQVDDDKIEVIYNGFEYRANNVCYVKKSTNKYGITKPYILYVGTLAPHKNIQMLIRAFSIMKSQGFDYQLVVAGKKGWMYDDIFMEVKRLNLEKEVIFTGYVDDNDQNFLYCNCKFFAFVSTYEGFGFPPLEAMARQKPVLVSNTASIPEVVGDAGLYCNPFDVEDIAKKMITLATNEEMQTQLIRKGIERLKLFAWDRCSAQTYAVYEKVLNDRVNSYRQNIERKRKSGTLK